jgi:hypothetical protein
MDWVSARTAAQQARNLLMDLDEQAHRVRFMIRYCGSNFTGAFDAVLADSGIQTVLCNVRTPRMNAITERWIGGYRREILDRTLLGPALTASRRHSLSVAGCVPGGRRRSSTRTGVAR